MSRPPPAERPAGSQAVDPAPFGSWCGRSDVVRVCPSGELDIDTVGQIRGRLENAAATGAKHVVLDLRGVTFLDSTGLRLVLEADAASRAQGWEFVLIGGPADVQRVFDLTSALGAPVPHGIRARGLAGGARRGPA